MEGEIGSMMFVAVDFICLLSQIERFAATRFPDINVVPANAGTQNHRA
jgi:hypothetical protein